ncbi:beta-1,4-N-acetylgalactosaminyltransferase bre-4 isoform X2 [Teleopsis dalmanni]|uniref:beta-1,4-N-acetylgalactosaminyltransferase bre-4 isoform X2 n=1 Tax=Teleopsis dalmanni TaxID=139649 RepID=UPI0018CE3AEB|nr:beta-1,4-N-acetylgalactosaminyltransferase bre-4 isoform X2 [Teleopsis dalmanni]
MKLNSLYGNDINILNVDAVMSLFTTNNGVRALLFVVCLLFLFNIIVNYFGYKNENESSFSKLRKIHNYTNTNGDNGVLYKIAPKHSLDASIVLISSTSEPNGRLVSNTVESILNSSHNVYSSTNLFTTSQITFPECISSSNEEKLFVPNVTLESLDVVEEELGPLLEPGGFFQPKNCTPKHHVAIVVPFRDRYAHLSIFIRNIHPFLMRQNIAYRIFIVEQTNGKPFNRAAMMNIGFLEALKIYPWDCFIFHDVDLLPLDERNIYSCPRQPRHMSVAIDTLNYRLPYRAIFGGVSAMTTEHFRKVNGFSNSYFGWGGEDDDMSNRLKHANLFISRYPINIARYIMLKHRKEKANPKRYENLVNGINRFEMDGINSIKYDLYSIKYFPMFTWYLAEIKVSDVTS